MQLSVYVFFEICVIFYVVLEILKLGDALHCYSDLNLVGSIFLADSLSWLLHEGGTDRIWHSTASVSLHTPTTTRLITLDFSGSTVFSIFSVISFYFGAWVTIFGHVIGIITAFTFFEVL